ncbi:MAG: zinc ribbon domain-containing protein [Clostridiales bacterium]|nr:zinc ribbon domain-containing protein [Clostridiales bacterium]MCD7827842.1 zinc ribbon domain-containing protein [Clostridiales bacterium]
MKKYLKKLLVVAMAVGCVCSVHVTVAAMSNVSTAAIGSSPLTDWLYSLLYPDSTTTAANDDNTTTTEPSGDNTTTTAASDDNTTVADPVNNSGTGTVTTTEATTYSSSNYQYTYTTQTATELTTVTTTAAEEEEDSSLPFSASLTDLFEEDTAAVIVQTPTEAYTIGSALTINNDDEDSSVPWQTVALIAAAVLFVILAALVAALVIQRNNRPAVEKSGSASTFVGGTDNTSATPVIPEIMTPERIAELLGSASSAGGTSANGGAMTSEESAAAIKNAALLGQLTGGSFSGINSNSSDASYDDDLIRKYTDSPSSSQNTIDLDPDSATGEDILKATESMLNEITAGEKYAGDVSGVSVSLNSTPDEIDGSAKDETDNAGDEKSESSETRICPNCGKPVMSGDSFCHSCGAYVE